MNQVIERTHHHDKLQLEDGQQITLNSESLGFRWPGGAYAWKRPVSVSIEKGNDRTIIKISSITQILTIGLYLMSAMLLLRTFLFRKRRSHK